MSEPVNAPDDEAIKNTLEKDKWQIKDTVESGKHFW